jgi:hypothetical protein
LTRRQLLFSARTGARRTRALSAFHIGARRAWPVAADDAADGGAKRLDVQADAKQDGRFLAAEVLGHGADISAFAGLLRAARRAFAQRRPRPQSRPRPKWSGGDD